MGWGEIVEGSIRELCKGGCMVLLGIGRDAAVDASGGIQGMGGPTRTTSEASNLRDFCKFCGL